MGKNSIDNILKNLSPEQARLFQLKLNRHLQKEASSSHIPVSPLRKTAHDWPLSFAQEGLWFLNQMELGNSFYNMVVAVRLRGPLRVIALEHCINKVVQRHEILRTTFVNIQGQPRQVITAHLTVSIPVIDLRAEPQGQGEQLAHQHAFAAAKRPFDLKHGPLLNAMLLQLAEQEYILVLTMHHIIMDGWSIGILIHELSMLYAAFVEKKPAILPALPIQYADYAAWQRERLQGDVLERQLNYWKEQLRDMPALLDMPTDHPRPPVQSYRGARETLVISSSVGQSLKTLCQKEDVTPFMVLLAAWSLLLGMWSEQEDILIGSPTAGRTHHELESLVGLFINTLVMRINLAGEPTFRELLQQVHEVALGAYAHQDLPYEKFVEMLAPERDLSHQPLFNTVFILQNTPVTEISSPELSLQKVVFDSQSAKYDLELSLFETAQGKIEGYLEYSTDLFEIATIQCILCQYQQVLECVTAQPELPINMVPLVLLRQRLHHRGNRVTMRNYQLNLSVIEEQLLRLPAIQQVVVSVWQNREKQGKLLAYVVLQDDQQWDEQSLRQQARVYLPRYQVPSNILILNELPLTPEGEIDLKALEQIPIPEKAVEGPDRPHTVVEEQLIAIWCDVLQIKQVGIFDNFFELGGHSLLATQVVARIINALQSEMEGEYVELEGMLLSTLFEEPTIAALAEQVEHVLLQEETTSQAPALCPVGRDRVLPLSFMQERLWFLDQLEPGNPFYNIMAAFLLRGPCNVEALHHSLNEIVQRHESLRTTFVSQGGQLQQIIAQQVTWPLDIHDLRIVPDEQREQVTYQLALEITQSSFDLARGPLVRARLIQYGEQEYVLVLTMHHIIADGWSMGILFNELSTRYAASVQGISSQFHPLPIQYADYAVWQREWLMGEVMERQLSYWKTALQEAPTMLMLPSDHPRPPIQSYQGAREAVQISSGLSQQLRLFCQEERVTPFMVLLAAWGLLLGRWSGQEDLLIGTPIAGRKHLNLEALIGFFVNTLVMRIQLADHLSFRELVQRVRNVALEAYAHQELPFEKLVEELAPERDLSHQPLFQVMFMLQNTPQSVPALPVLDIQPFPIDNQTAKFDLTLELFETPDGFQGSLEYSTNLFEAVTIKQQVQQFVQVLETVLEQPDQSISLVSLLNAHQRELLLVQWNAREAAYPQTQCVHELFEAQVERTPEATAVVYNQHSFTYRQLNHHANQLAHYLRKQGIGPEKAVGLYLEPSLEMIVAILGVLKAGGAYVPLDPAYPQERLTFMVSDAGIAKILTQQRLLIQSPEWNLHTICLDKEDEGFHVEECTNLMREGTPLNLAYIIYTSGSTGQPKGVMVNHQGLVNYLYWCMQEYAVDGGESVPVNSSISFDLTITSLFTPLLAGKRVILLPASRGVEALSQILDTEKQFSLLKITPAHLALLRQRITPEKARDVAKVFVIGGEALMEKDLDFWRMYASETRFINEYGPSEAVVGCCTYTYSTDAAETETGIVPIGCPIHNVHVYVLDRHLNPVPIGVWGELYISSSSLARGYFQNPALTAEKFIPNPFDSSAEYSRMYKTGDIVRYGQGGILEFRGRNDQQIKLRGFRIEPGEIEAVLKKHLAIQEAVVQPVDTSREARLIAYIVCQGEETPSKLDVQDFLRKHLPEYMIPAHIILVEALPLTTNGKLDRTRLPKPDKSIFESKGKYARARDSLELRLIQIWEDVLEVRPIGIHDDFFQLGGHSFLAIHLMQEIEKQLECSLPIVELFKNPTIEHLADLLRQPLSAHQQSCLVPIKVTGTKPPLFFAHPVGGMVHCYLELAQSLEEDQPLYGFQASGFQEKSKPLQTVEEMASCYIKAMKTVQPEGPYHLGGWSMGGVIAFEMAQQLQKQGDEIASLILLDSQVPSTKGLLSSSVSVLGSIISLLRPRIPLKQSMVDQAKLLTDFVIHLVGSSLTNEQANSFDAHAIETLYDDLQHLQCEDQLPFVLEHLNKTKAITLNIDVHQFERFFAVFRANYIAGHSYRPKSYTGGLIIASVEETMAANIIGPDLGWKRLVKGEITIHTFPCDHYALIRRPNVQFLAKSLNRRNRVASEQETMHKASQKKAQSPLRWIMEHVIRYKLHLAGFMVGTIFYSLLTASISVLIGVAVNAALQRTQAGEEALLTISLSILAIVLVRGLTGVLARSAIEILARRFERDARDELYQSLLSKSQVFHDRQRVGDITAIATNDVRQLSSMFSPGFDLIFEAVANLVTPIVFIGFIKVNLLLVPILFVIVCIMSLLDFSRRIGPISERMRKQFGIMNATLTEAVTGIEIVQAATQENQEQEKFEKQAKKYRDLFVKNGYIQVRYLPPLLVTLAIIGAFAYGLLLVSQGSLSIGSLVAYLILMASLRFPVSISLFSFILLQIGIASAGRILKLMQEEVEIDENKAGYSGRLNGELIFDNVTFGYGTTPVLKNITFHAERGQTLAIVGQTGTGKSTLAKLINRTYDVDAGRILIDNTDIRDWKLSALRSQIATIEQDTFLFSRSIAQNITFGLGQSVDAEKVEQAAQQAQAHQFITSFKDGYETIIGERGVTLSGGQRQRLAIARALLIEPSILIIDDAMSAIDSSTEDEIQKAILRLKNGRTTILITNRLSQIQHADKVLILDGGELIDQGTHTELLNRCDLYRRIFARQITSPVPDHARRH